MLKIIPKKARRLLLMYLSKKYFTSPFNVLYSNDNHLQIYILESYSFKGLKIIEKESKHTCRN